MSLTGRDKRPIPSLTVGEVLRSVMALRRFRRRPSANVTCDIMRRCFTKMRIITLSDERLVMPTAYWALVMALRRKGVKGYFPFLEVWPEANKVMVMEGMEGIATLALV